MGKTRSRRSRTLNVTYQRIFEMLNCGSQERGLAPFRGSQNRHAFSSLIRESEFADSPNPEGPVTPRIGDQRIKASPNCPVTPFPRYATRRKDSTRHSFNSRIYELCYRIYITPPTQNH